MSLRSYKNVTALIDFCIGSSNRFFIALGSKFTFYNSVDSTGDMKILIIQAYEPFMKNNCDISCNSCFGNTDHMCFSCKYYEVDSSNPYFCGICDKSCSVCYGNLSSQCSQCNIGYILQGNYCYKNLSCGDGYFQSLGLNSCIKCDGSCLTCFGASFNDCNTCTQGYYLDGTSCSTQCPLGKYKENLSCSPCSSSC